MMKTRTVLLVAVLAAGLVLAGCSSDNPTAPPRPTPAAQNVSLTVAKTVAGVNEAVVAEARVTVSGQPAPDGTSVTFTASSPGFFTDNGSSEVVRTTSSGGRATAAVNSAVAADVQVTARVPGGTDAKTVRFEGSRNPLDLAVYSITPARGRPEGGQQVIIRGQGFSVGTRVIFLIGGTRFTAEVVTPDVTGTQLLVVTPAVDQQQAAITEQVADVVVEVDYQDPQSGAVVTAEATLPAGFTFEKVDSLPRLYSVDPNQGVAAGGETVVLYGTNLYPPVRVLFGNDESYVINISADNSQVQVRTPARTVSPTSPETVTVTVYTRAGSANQAMVTLANAFTYYFSQPSPQIYYVVPNRGSDRGGEEVTIHGQWLANAQVQFSLGGAVQVVDADPAGTWLRVLTPDVSASNLTTDTPVDVTVTTPSGTYTLPSGYVYMAESSLTPEIFAIAPNSGPLEGGTRVTITGRRFAYPVQVFFGDRLAQVVSVNFNEVICLAPSITPSQPGTPTTVNVTVRNIASGQVSNPVTYRYGEAMFISGISPNTGSMLGGTVVTIYGQGFSSPVRAVIALGSGELEMEVLSVSGTEIIARTRPVPVGARSCTAQSGPVIVTNLNSNVTAEGPNFTYLAMNPLISSVEVIPNMPPPSPTNYVREYTGAGLCTTPYTSYTVRIRGTGFEQRPGTTQSAMVVNFGTIGADVPTTWVSDNEVTAQLIDLSGIPLNEVSCIPLGGGCGLQYVPTPLAVSITNSTNTCSDTLGGAMFIAPCDVTCRPVSVASITLTKAPDGNLAVGQLFQLTATIAPVQTTNTTVSLVCSPSLTCPASISIPTGQVTGIGNGSVLTAGQHQIQGSSGSGACAVASNLVQFSSATNLQVTIESVGGGTGTVNSSPAGINCSSGTCSANFTVNQVLLTASPTAGVAFTGWTGDCAGCGTNLGCNVPMDAPAKSCTATFTIN